MKTFLDENFLLTTATAERLYHDYAVQMPVIDYHCHLDPALIAADHQFKNLTEAWLKGDHYKWRAMRTNGIPERFITGDTTDEEKFAKWAETVPYSVRNPLYHWTHLELWRYFGITEPLSRVTGHEIYDRASTMLNSSDFTVRRLLEKMNVEVVCTTDDPLDTLDSHRQIAESGWSIKVLPTWRPDRVLAFALGQMEAWNKYLDSLSEITGIRIKRYDDLIDALRIRHKYFHDHGCRLSDHGLNTFPTGYGSLSSLDEEFRTLRQGGTVLDQKNLSGLAARILFDLSCLDAEKGWVQQFHIGAMRNTNTRMISLLGPDTGFDSIGDEPVALPMARFFDRLEREGKLAKTILYNLNPRDNEVFATMTGNFQDGSVPGKMQWGSGWWFLDQKDGMEKQLNTLSNMGLLSRFVGMLTDSRSFLSYPRHEYFRRILCNLIGRDVENGELPGDVPFLGQVVQDVCYFNALNYFDFK